MLDTHELLSGNNSDGYSEYEGQQASEDMKLLLCNGKRMEIHTNLYEFLVRLRAQKRGLPSREDLFSTQEVSRFHPTVCRPYKVREMAYSRPTHKPRTILRGGLGAKHGRSYAHLHRRHIRAGQQGAARSQNYAGCFSGGSLPWSPT